MSQNVECVLQSERKNKCTERDVFDEVYMYCKFYHHRIVVNLLSRCCTSHEPKYISGSDKQSQDLNSIDPLKKQENFCHTVLTNFILVQ